MWAVVLLFAIDLEKPLPIVVLVFVPFFDEGGWQR